MKRRQLLGAAAGSLALPFLGMQKARSQEGRPPLRFISLFDSYGLPLHRRGINWVRSEVGDYRLTPADLGTTLQPLAAYTDNMLIPTGIPTSSLREAKDTGDHNSVCHALCGSRVISGGSRARPGPNAYQSHPSLDYVIGHHLSGDYGLDSPRVYPHLFFTNRSQLDNVTYCYDGNGQQIRAIAGSPAIVETAFAEAGDSGDASLLQASVNSKRAMLGLARERVTNIRPQLINANASTVLDAYHASLEDFAKELDTRGARICSAPDAVGVAGEAEDTPFIMDAIRHIVSCDLASSITYAVGGEWDNNLRYKNHLYDASVHDPEIGDLMASSFHGASHRTDEVADAVHEIVRTNMAEEIARLLDALRETTDVDGVSSVFDNTVLYLGSNMSHNVHSQDNLPNAIIAGKNARLRGGYHYDCSGRTNNDLLTTLARGLALEIDEFGGYSQDTKLENLNNGPIESMLAV